MEIWLIEVGGELDRGYRSGSLRTYTTEKRAEGAVKRFYTSEYFKDKNVRVVRYVPADANNKQGK